MWSPTTVLYYFVKIFFVGFFFKVGTTEGKACLSCMVVLYNFCKNCAVKKSSSLKPSSESSSTHRNPLAISIVPMKRKHNVLPQEKENAH